MTLPRFDDAARANVLGGGLVALVNLVVIFATVPFPTMEVRLGHLFFEALNTLAGSLVLSLPFCLLGWLLPPRRAWTLAGWLVLTAGSAVLMAGLLATYLNQGAYHLLGGAHPKALKAALTLGCGAAVTLAHLLGHLTLERGFWFVLSLGAAGLALTANHAVLRDDYEAVHAAALWPTSSLLGWGLLGLARKLRARPEPNATDRARALRTLGAWSLGAAALSMVLTPPNRVRLELFKQPGAGASWAFAQVLWSGPKVEPLPARPPERDYSAALFDQARADLPENPVVVLLTVDSFRADVLTRPKGAARYPALQRLTREGAWFATANTPGSQTSVSLSSLFTGKYFSELFWKPKGKGRARYLYPADDETVRFPAELARAKVPTTHVSSVSFLTDTFGLTGGFDVTVPEARGKQHVPSRRVVSRLVERLREHGEGPGFFYAHLMDLHEPYDLGKKKRGRPFERYLSEAEGLDAQIERVMSVLEKRFEGRGYLFVSADHGEAFGEHGTRFHGKTLYEELVHVPLILWGPRIPPSEPKVRAGLIDLGPTTLHLFGLPRPPHHRGRSLLPIVRGLADEVPRHLYFEGRLRRGMYLDDGRKIIEDTVRKTVELYDLESDPKERSNLFDPDDPEDLAALGQLRAFFDAVTLERPGYRPPYRR